MQTTNNLRWTLKKVYSNYACKSYQRHAMEGDEHFFHAYQGVPLNASEKKKVDTYWGPLYNQVNAYKFFEIYKKYWGVDTEFVPGDYFFPFILKALNPSKALYTLEHKSLYPDTYNFLKQPDYIVRCINGTCINALGTVLTLEEAISRISKSNSPILLKPTTGSFGGSGIQLVEPGTSYKVIDTYLSLFNNNWIAQHIVKQSETTAIFNPTSLNTFRINTLCLNGEAFVCESVFRVGGKGSIVDNACSGGVMIGLDCINSKLRKYGFNYAGERLEKIDDIVFENHPIPCLSKVVDTALLAHKHIAICGIVGWDFALDVNNDPVFIEANLYWPTLSLVQLANGKPFFGENLNKVIDFVNKIKNEDPLYFRK